jgi:hypothetical protein
MRSQPLLAAILSAVALFASCSDVEVKPVPSSILDAGVDAGVVATVDTGLTGDGAVSGGDAAGDDVAANKPDITSTVPQPPTLCEPCSSSDDCAAVTGKKSKCNDHGSLGFYCGAGCGSDADCRSDFRCTDIEDIDGNLNKQCVPQGESADTIGECFCSAGAKADELETSCYNELKVGGKVVGSCKGKRACGDTGLKACDAEVPTKEVCDGTDNDCSGAPDDNVCDDGQACTTDACDKDGKCLNTATNGKCDDGNPCTVADNCGSGACKGATNTCDDANGCTTDSCVPGEGCKHTKINGCNKCEKDADCNDNKGCTVDRCLSLSESCANVPKACDDGDSCTVDSCVASTGNCKFTAATVCAGAMPIPYSSNFNCGAKSNDLWELTKPAKGPAWAVDGNPAPPGAKSPACSLNFNNGTDFQCPAGATAVFGSALSPWIDATKAHPKANLRVAVQVGGTWENNNNDEFWVEYTFDGKQFNKLYDLSPNSKVTSWQNRQFSLGSAKGKKFRLRFRFFTNSCKANTGTGPFIDDLKVYDAGCYQDGDCPSTNPCVVTACVNHACNSYNKCNDGVSCTSDSCNKGACVFKPNNEGKVCTDNGSCSASKICTGGKCVGGTTAGDGAPCNDNKQCTVNDECKGGVCAGTPTCDDGNPCTADSCWLAAGKCTYKPITSKCEDDNACTSNDNCVLGECTGKEKDCGDNDVCTDDSCKPTDATCVNKGGGCDDGDSCTIDTCDSKTGKCGYKADGTCGATVKMPYEQPFNCVGTSHKAWELTGTAGGPTWKVDGTPASPGSNSGACSLNFNNGKDFTCPTGAKSVGGEATSPWIDASSAKTTQMRLRFRLSGSWENNNNDELKVEGSLDGKAWSTIYDTSNTNITYWYTRTLGLGQYKGKKFKLRFRFFTTNCTKNDGTGPFIDDVKVWDLGCSTAKDCGNGNACLSWSCTGSGSCSAKGTICKDENPCTLDQCNVGTGKCAFPFANDGQGCSDGDLCSDLDRCQAGKCHGTVLACDDKSKCTKDSCDKVKGCVFDPVCLDNDPCSEDICNEATQKCSHKPAAAGAGCDDGSVCTAFESCKSGKCDGKPGNVGVLVQGTFSSPTGIVADGNGVTYFAARGVHKIYKVEGGKAVVLAGSTAGFADGAGATAKFSNPQGLMLVGTTLYLADQSNNRIRAIAANGAVTTVAGSTGGFVDGPKSKARFNNPHAIVAGNSGVFYVLDSYNHRIRRLTANGTVSTFTGSNGGFLDGPKNVARFNNPRGLAIDKSGVMYVADTYNSRIRKVATDGAVSTLAGTTPTGKIDGIGMGARFYRPHGIALGEPGWLYVADTYNSRIRRVSYAGKVTTIAGTTNGFLNGSLGTARFYRPWHLTSDGEGGLLVADNANSRIRTIKSAAGQVCNDNNVCTTDACDPKSGACKNVLASKCDDNDPCTFDGCSPADGKCTHIANACDDGDSCTAGSCAASDGSCTHKAVSGCNTIHKIGYAQAFNCGSKSSSDWVLTGSGGPKWAVDGSPTPPKPYSAKCSLNFNNGKDYACAPGAKKVSGTATSPWLDATKVSSIGGLWMRFRYSGRWETNNNDELYVETTSDEKVWSKLSDLSYTNVNGWSQRSIYLNQYAGKKFKVRFRFETTDCNQNSWPGPFIDDLTIRDLNCTTPSDCGDGTMCTKDLCNNGRCQWSGVNCNDFDPCTHDSCKPATGCANVPQADGAYCTDSDSCTSSDACDGGKCSGVGTGKDGATCSDGKSCTFGDICTSGKCVGIFGCDDGNPCSADICNQYGQCQWKDAVAVCDDNNPCTTDTCQLTASGKCSHAAKCDDHNSCTSDTCDAKTGACASKAIVGCQTTLPYETNFACAAGNSGWKFASVHQGGPQWAIDKTPALPVAETGGCTLNFNDGTGYACPAGEKSVSGTAESPWIDGANFPKLHTQLYMEFRINGRWALSNAKGTLQAEASKDGKTWLNRRTMSYNLNSYSTQQVSLSGYAGGKFKVRFKFFTANCGALTGSGPFIDRMRIFDRRCFSDADCVNASACITSTCKNYACSNVSAQCADPGLCHAKACSAKWGCRHVPRNDGTACGDSTGCAPQRCRGLKCKTEKINDGAGCNDGDTCTTGEKCTGGKCIGSSSLNDGDPCSDANACTTADTCGSGKCAGLTGRVQETGGTSWSGPQGIVITAKGLVVASNSNQHRLRVYKGGAWADFAGSSYSYKDGKGAAAGFRTPMGLAAGSNDTIYVADRTNNAVRKVLADGTVSTVAGSPTGGKKDGKGAAAQFSLPTDVAFSNGTLYVTDFNNHAVRKITADGTVTTFAGGVQGFADGKGTAAKFYRPGGVAVDANGVVYVSDSYNHRIRKITQDGIVTTFAGSSYGYLDGIGTKARFAYPQGLNFSGTGQLYVADKNNHRIRRIDAIGRVVSITGERGYGQAGGALSQAQWAYPNAVAVGGNGAIWVADTSNNRIRRIVWDIGNVCDDATLCTHNSCAKLTGACNNGPLDCDDNNACSLDLCNGNNGKCASTSYACDDGNPCTTDSCDKTKGCKHAFTAGCQVCVTNADCGDGKPCTKDTCDASKGCKSAAIAGCAGCKTASECNDGNACTSDTCVGGKCGNVATPDNGLCTDGSICTAVDNCVGGKCSGKSVLVSVFAGDGSAAYANGFGDKAKLNAPTDVAVDSLGNVFVADTGNKRIRWSNPWGQTYNLTNLSQPTGVAVGNGDTLYYTDRAANRIYEQKWGYDNGPKLLAGSGVAGLKNGAATQATFKGPSDVAAGPDSVTKVPTVWVSDTGNNLIRKISGGVASTQVILSANSQLTSPTYLALEGSHLFVVESGKQQVVRVNVAGKGELVVISKGAPTNPTGLAVSKHGLWITDATAHTVTLVGQPTSANTAHASAKVLGSKSGYANGSAHVALFGAPSGIAVGAGGLFIADTKNNRIRQARWVSNLCGDGATCLGDFCDAKTGKCGAGSAKSVACDDGDSKTVDFCHVSVGKCVHK